MCIYVFIELTLCQAQEPSSVGLKQKKCRAVDLACIVFGFSKISVTSGSVCPGKNIVPAGRYPTGKLPAVDRITFPQKEH